MAARHPSSARQAGQFAAYANQDANSRQRFPFLLDVQSDLIADLETRIVVPLVRQATMRGAAIATLMPMLDVDGEPHVMMTPQLAGIARKRIGAAVADLSSQRDAILAALDLLITGF